MSAAGTKIQRIEIDGHKTSFKPEQTNNIYLLVKGRKAVLVDACYEHAQSERALEDALKGLELTDLLITHFHPDHAEYATGIRKKYGARLWAHPGETKIGRHVKPEEIDEAITGDQAIDTGAGIPIKAVATPGHTLTHTCFLFEETGTLFTGDHIIGEGTPWVGPPHGEIRAYLDSLKKVRALPLKDIRGGHGPLIGNPVAKVDEYYEHRLMRERQILEQLSTGPKTIDEMVRVIYADVDKKVHGLAALVVRGHLDKLLSEKRVKEHMEKGRILFEVA